MTRLAETVADMRKARADARAERWNRERIDMAVQSLDRLIDALEQLNLKERARVPLAWQTGLAELACQLPVECQGRLRAGISPTRLLDNVYDIQQEVFWLKRGELEDGGELAQTDLELEACSVA
jgi:hypothetical protein